MPTDDENKKFQKAIERIIADLAALEREYWALPADLRKANPDLARWFVRSSPPEEKGRN